MNPFSPTPNSFRAQTSQPPADLNSFLAGIDSVGLNGNGQPVGTTGGLIPLLNSERDQLAAFTIPSQAGYNGSVVNPLQKLNELLGIQPPEQGMRVPQSQFALPQGSGQGTVNLPMQGAPSSTPMIGQPSHTTQAPTPVSAFGEQIRVSGPQTRNGATFSATEDGFSIVQDPNTIPAQSSGLPQFLQGVSPRTIAPVINAMNTGGDPEQIRQALLAGAPAPQGLSAQQQAAWTLEQAALGQQSAALYDQIRGSGIGNGQYGRGLLTNAYNQALGGANAPIPGLTPVQRMAGQAQTRQDAARLGGQPMTSAQMETLRSSGFDFKATPAGDGTYIVKDVSPFGPTNKPTTTETVTNQEATMRSKAAFEDNEAIAKLGQSAETAVRDIDRAAALIDAGAKTGFGANWLLQAKQLGKALDIPGIDGVKETEELRTLMGNFIMGRVQQTKGAVSNAEMKLFEEYSPSLNKTPEGNKAILAYARQAYDRSQRIGQLVDNLRNQNISEGEIRRQVNDYREKNPLDASVLQNPASQTGSGLTPEARRARIEELRRKLGGNR